MPAGHTLPLTFSFDFHTASYFRISSVVPEPEPVIFKRFRFRFRPEPSGSTGSCSVTGSASLVWATYGMNRANRERQCADIICTVLVPGLAVSNAKL